MITLTYGQQIPEQGERGTPIFQALEDNFTRTDGHNHDGVNSALLTPTAFVGIVDTIPLGSWAAYGGPIGHYRQLVTMHAGFLFDTAKLSFRTVGGSYIYPTVERVTNLTYYVYSTDNAIDFQVMYGG